MRHWPVNSRLHRRPCIQAVGSLETVGCESHSHKKGPSALHHKHNNKMPSLSRGHECVKSSILKWMPHLGATFQEARETVKVRANQL